MPYTAAQQAFDAGMPKGLRWYTRARLKAKYNPENVFRINHNIPPGR